MKKHLINAQCMNAVIPSAAVKKWVATVNRRLGEGNSGGPMLQPYRTDSGDQVLSCTYSGLVIVFVVSESPTDLSEPVIEQNGVIEIEVSDLVDALLLVHAVETSATCTETAYPQLSTAG